MGFVLENVDATAEIIRDGLDVLLGIIDDPKQMQIYIKRAYLATVVKALRAAWTSPLATKEAASSLLGGATKAASGLKSKFGVPQAYLNQMDPKVRAAGKQKAAKSFAHPRTGNRKDREYRNKVLAIADAFARSVLVKGNTISLRPIKYYAQNWQMTGSNRGKRISTGSRPFRSVFMIHEFGTGTQAVPAPRPYMNPKATPWKVPPLLGGGGGEWVPVNPAARIMRMQYQDILNNRRTKKGYLTIRAHNVRWAEVVQEGRGGAHVFTTEARGLVKAHRKLIQNFKVQLIQDLVAAVKKKVPEFDLLLVPADLVPEAVEFTSTL